MGMHYLRTAQYRDFRREQIFKMTELEVIQFFATVRWGCIDKQCCPSPSCASFKTHYWRSHRHQWRCRDCGRDFSVTTGTAFAYHKKSLQTIFSGLFGFCATSSGISSIEAGADLGMTDKSAWYLHSKIREVLLKTRPVDIGIEQIQVDGGWFGGKRRDANKHSANSHIDARAEAIKEKIEGAPTGRQRRKKQMKPGAQENAVRRLKRRCVLVIRELFAEKGAGARRTIVTVANSENEFDAVNFIKKHVPTKSTIWSDEGHAFASLARHGYIHQQVVHSVEYVSDDGVNDNQAESYFCRLRRSEYGVHHQFSPLHLFEYANEKAWREDERRTSLKEKVTDLIRKILTSGKAKMYRGYYQGKRPKSEMLNM
jgi:transposase-like protein